MRYFYVILTAFACFGYAALPARAADTLTGEMASRNFLLGGTWSCTSNVPSIMAMPAMKEPLTVTFDVAPRNVLHAALNGPDERADRYFGYSTRFKNYWTVGASSHGIHDFERSTDGKTFSGTGYLGSGSMSDTTTYTRISDTQTTLREVLSGDGKSFTIETSCSRAT